LKFCTVNSFRKKKKKKHWDKNLSQCHFKYKSHTDWARLGFDSALPCGLFGGQNGNGAGYFSEHAYDCLSLPTSIHHFSIHSFIYHRSDKILKAG
jgi:hypothetical protein